MDNDGAAAAAIIVAASFKAAEAFVAQASVRALRSGMRANNKTAMRLSFRV